MIVDAGLCIQETYKKMQRIYKYLHEKEIDLEQRTLHEKEMINMEHTMLREEGLILDQENNLKDKTSLLKIGN
jgi:hypothetical protein